jgi:hypothetical protein
MRACAFILLAPLLLVAPAASPGSAAAQTVRGRVIDAAGSGPVSGAVVILYDSAGTRLRGGLTGPDGLFALRTPGPGTYRLRAEMIGRRSVESGALAVVADPPFQTLELPFEPIRLSTLDVNAARRCSLKDEITGATHVVWEEVQKALRGEWVTREQEMYRFVITKTRRRLNRNASQVLEEGSYLLSSINNNPFSSLAPDVLARDGYVRVDEQSRFWVYGPNTDVLLSPSFVATHCLALRRGEDHPGEIGLAFEPAPGRGLPDIEGTLWLDETTAELRTLEFTYRNIPRQLYPGRRSGFAEFQRLPGGAWIIRRWWLRAPVPAARGRGTEVDEAGGEVMHIEPITVSPPDTIR